MIIIGLDIGTQSLKAVAASRDLHALGSASVTYPYQAPASGQAEQDPPSSGCVPSGPPSPVASRPRAPGPKMSRASGSSGSSMAASRSTRPAGPWGLP